MKAREHQATPSLKRYVMLEQDGVGATVYARSGEAWTQEISDADADAVVAQPEIGVELPLVELHEGLAFESEPTDWRPSDLRRRQV